jgi:hypothetical protein
VTGQETPQHLLTPESFSSSSRRKPSPAGRSRSTTLLVVVALLVVVIGGAAAIGVGSRSAAASPPPPAAPRSAPAGLIVRHAFSSPYVLVDGARNYLYTGGTGPGHAPFVPVRPFTTLADLPAATDAMPTPPAGTWGWIWTVDVQKVATGYAMWFTTQYNAKLNPEGVADQCLGTATSASPTGPFVPSAGPAICQTWGSIDPRVVTAPGGQRYLIWKSDLNADKQATIPTTIWEQPLAADGVTLEGTARKIATSTQKWEGALAESPDMVNLGGTYYLFFSGNSSSGPRNAVGMMKCAGIRGPCVDNRSTPFVSSNRQGTGPGEESLFQKHGVTWLLYSPNAAFGTNFFRPLAVARVAVGPHGPYLASFAGAVPGG